MDCLRLSGMASSLRANSCMLARSLHYYCAHPDLPLGSNVLWNVGIVELRTGEVSGKRDWKEYFCFDN